MALTFKHTEIPPFARREEDALLFNQDGSLEYYIPEDYFGSGKSTSATVEGAYVKLMGSFNYRIIAANGSPGKLKAFNFPTMFLCRPGKIEKRKDIQLDNDLDPDDYRVLICLDSIFKLEEFQTVFLMMNCIYILLNVWH